MSNTEMQHDQTVSDREKEILLVATKLFQRDGFEGTPVARIAAEAGMTPANLYWYFSSKQELLKAVLIEQYRWSFDVLLAADDESSSATDRLLTYVKTFTAFQLDKGGDTVNFGYIALQNSLSAEAKAPLRNWQVKHRGLLKSILRAGLDSGEFVFPNLTIATSMLATSIEYVFLWFDERGHLTKEDVGEEYARLAHRMLGGSPTAFEHQQERTPCPADHSFTDVLGGAFPGQL